MCISGRDPVTRDRLHAALQWPLRSCQCAHPATPHRSRAQHRAAAIAASRIVGISSGVALSLLLAILVLPTSAHAMIESGLKDALQSTLALTALCWLPLEETAVFGITAADREAGTAAAALEDTLSFLAIKEMDEVGNVRDAEATIVQVRLAAH